MPNYVNDLVKGLNKGLAGLTEGFVQKRYRDNADELFKLGQTYLTEMGVQQKEYLKKANELANPKAPETGYGIPGNFITSLINKEGTDLNKTYVENSQKTLGTMKESQNDNLVNYLNVMGQLSDNPFGKGKADVLETIYKSKLKEKPDRVSLGSKLYEVNADGTSKLLIDASNNKLTTISGMIPTPVKDENGYGLKLLMQDEQGNMVWKRVPLTEEEYKGYNDMYLSKTVSPEEKNQYALELFRGRQEIKIDLGGGSKSKGSGKGKETYSALASDIKPDVDAHLSDVATALSKYGTWDNVPQNIKDDLNGQRSYLLGRGVKEESLNEWGQLYRSGELTDKQLKRDINKDIKTPRKTFSVTLAGKQYDLMNDKSRELLRNEIENGIKNGNLKIEALKNKLNQLPKDVQDFLKQIIGW